jgi:hypothetical protein
MKMKLTILLYFALIIVFMSACLENVDSNSDNSFWDKFLPESNQSDSGEYYNDQDSTDFNMNNAEENQDSLDIDDQEEYESDFENETDDDDTLNVNYEDDHDGHYENEDEDQDSLEINDDIGGEQDSVDVYLGLPTAVTILK